MINWYDKGDVTVADIEGINKQTGSSCHSEGCAHPSPEKANKKGAKGQRSNDSSENPSSMQNSCAQEGQYPFVISCISHGLEKLVDHRRQTCDFGS